MSQEQPQHPVTYGDVFESVQGELASQPITVEDAALMQKAETLAFGQTRKGGPASVMQAAIDKNAKTRAVDLAALSDTAEHVFGVTETIIDGEVHQQEFVGDQCVADRITYDSTFPEVAATKGITIGEALEEVAFYNPDKLVDQNTARAIMSAEARASGVPLSVTGGVGALAQSAAQRNTRGEQIKLAEVLDDATEKMLLDKVVTQEDVEKVKHVEGSEGVITPSLQGAVDANASANRYLEAQDTDYKLPADSLLNTDKLEAGVPPPASKLDHLD